MTDDELALLDAGFTPKQAEVLMRLLDKRIPYPGPEWGVKQDRLREASQSANEASQSASWNLDAFIERMNAKIKALEATLDHLEAEQ
jgi:hypothetical protein